MVLIEGYCCLYGSINKKNGLIVWPGAYAKNEESRRPLMWNHESRLESFLGRVILENQDVGVYCVGILEDESLLSKHKDLYLSARSAKPTIEGIRIVAGDITEVSLVTESDYYDAASEPTRVKILQN